MLFHPARFPLCLALALGSLTGCAASAPVPPVQAVALPPEPPRPVTPRPAPTLLSDEDVVSLCGRGDPRMEEVSATLRRARTLEPRRPEAYYNEALWLDQMVARCASGHGYRVKEQSIRLFTWFLDLAGDDPAMAEPVADAQARIKAWTRAHEAPIQAPEDLPEWVWPPSTP